MLSTLLDAQQVSADEWMNKLQQTHEHGVTLQYKLKSSRAKTSPGGWSCDLFISPKRICEKNKVFLSNLNKLWRCWYNSWSTEKDLCDPEFLILSKTEIILLHEHLLLSIHVTVDYHSSLLKYAPNAYRHSYKYQLG